MDLFIGIDLGTSAAKLLLVDAEGKILNTVSKEYPISFPRPGWSEQSPAGSSVFSRKAVRSRILA